MMNRSAPMKRGGFKSKAPARPRRLNRSAEFASHVTPPTRAILVNDGKARACVPVPKFGYVRDERLRDMCRAMPCQCCGAAGPDAGVTWAHSNQGIHGHGRSVKASDVYVAAMCATCHRELDQGKAETRAQKVARWNEAHMKTVALAVRAGLWPKGMPIPLGVALNPRAVAHLNQLVAA